MSPELLAELRATERPVERLSISVPADLAKWVRDIAAEAGVSISRVVEVAIEHRRRGEDVR